MSCWTSELILLLCRTGGLSDRWVVGQVGCRTGGLSDKWVVGQVVGRTSGLSDKWVVGQVHVELYMAYVESYAVCRVVFVVCGVLPN